MLAACAVPPGWGVKRVGACQPLPASAFGRRWAGVVRLLGLIALAWFVKGDLGEFALDRELAVVDEQLATDTVLKEPERQLVDGHRVGLVGVRLEVADRNWPSRNRVETLGILHPRQLAVAAGGNRS